MALPPLVALLTPPLAQAGLDTLLFGDGFPGAFTSAVEQWLLPPGILLTLINVVPFLLLSGAVWATRKTEQVKRLRGRAVGVCVGGLLPGVGLLAYSVLGTEVAVRRLEPGFSTAVLGYFCLPLPLGGAVFLGALLGLGVARLATRTAVGS